MHAIQTWSLKHSCGKESASTAQWQSVGLVIERLLTIGSIPQHAMRSCVFRKDTLRLFPIRTEQSTRRMVAQPDETLPKRTPKVLRVGVARGI